MRFKNKPKVAVFMVTYNHARFIAQAIEGVIMQQTDFPVKLFIGEDCSTDKTREICQYYKERYPEQIELVLHGKNVGAVANAQSIYPLCFEYGKYTAMCEGDDYWTNPYKLQKQVDFLETNSDFAICFHNVKVIYENDQPFYLLNPPDQRIVSTIKHLIEDWFIGTCSCVFRNGFIEFPSWFIDCYSNDMVMWMLIGRHGKVRYLDDVMAVYRKHSAGMSFNYGVADDPHAAISFYENKVFMYDNMLREFNGEHSAEFKQMIGKSYLKLADLYRKTGKNAAQQKALEEYASNVSKYYLNTEYWRLRLEQPNTRFALKQTLKLIELYQKVRPLLRR